MKMKKRFIVAVAVMITSVAFAQTEFSLDDGIARIARDIEAELPVETRIAVMNFESPSQRFSDYVLEELQGYLVNNKQLVVIERSRLELSRNEFAFPMSGEVSDESAVSIGNWLGAQVIVTGSLTDIGSRYRLWFKVLDTETGVRRASAAVTVWQDTTVASMLPAEGVLSQRPPAQIPAKPDPALAAAYFNAGFAYYEAGQYAEAITDFTHALEVKGDDEAALRYRGLSYYALNDYDRAIADYTQVIRLKPNDANAYTSRGLAYDAKGDYDRTIDDYTQAISLDPNDAYAYMSRGDAYYYQDDYDQAIDDYTQAIRLDPNDDLAYYWRGDVYRNKGDYDRAIADYTQAIRLDPNDDFVYYWRGLAYYYKEDYNRAIADFTQAIRIDPDDTYAYLNRGRAYNNKEDYNRARADWEKALQLDPDFTSAWDALENLRKEGH
jgi:tetratricopeptide (TPR) repeat protein/TolB-like protein